MLKLNENPPALSPRARQLTELSGRWWVAHTKARCEKAFAFDLIARDIGYFLPMMEHTIFSGGRKRRALIPLFTSYVFFCGGAAERYAALRTGRLSQVIEVIDQERLIEELSALEQAIAAHAPLHPHPMVVAGQRCRVCAGPFEGVEGVVVRGSDGLRIVLEVSLLGQGAAIEIDAALLEPVESEALHRNQRAIALSG
jgi:transcriptional antiterminator RfaH